MDSSLRILESVEIGGGYTLHSPSGLVRALQYRHKFQQAFNLMPPVPMKNEYCHHCQTLVANLETESYRHQHGYLALASSALTCRLCWSFLHIVEWTATKFDNFSSSGGDQKVSEMGEISFEQAGTDEIRIIHARPDHATNDQFGRFRIRWGECGFECQSEIFGLANVDSSMTITFTQHILL